MTDSFSDLADAEANLQKRGATSNRSGRESNATESPRRRNTPDDTSQLPPNSPESECGVLGCILLSPNDCLGRCIEKLKEGGVVFYDLRLLTLYETLVGMYDRREQIDTITVMQRLKDDDTLEQVGGIVFLNQLQNDVPSAANLPSYLDIVLEKHRLRKMIATATQIVSSAFESNGDSDKILEEAEKQLIRLTQDRDFTGLRETKEIIAAAIAQLEAYFNRQGQLGGIATGFTDFDRLTDGLHPGEMIVIAARPSIGKTSWAMNVAENVVLNQKLPVGVFSLEMTSEQLMLRMLCSIARVSTRNIQQGFVAETDFPKLRTAVGSMATAPIYIDDSASLTLMQLRSKARRMAQQFGIKLFIIDYLQLLRTGSRGRDGRQQEVSDISAGIKALAKELNVPIIVLAQLNREVESRGGKPRLSDLRESGALEQDSDVVGLLYKPKPEKEEKENDAPPTDAEPVTLIIGKNRSGPSGECALIFFKSITRFESASKVSDNDIPEENQLPYKDQ